tara:strand:- start:505 stop:987 length:483 start_codon:yes stop_codon:yes gene_type:complete
MDKIYRFKLSEEFLAILIEFSTIHQYDKPIDFKEAFGEFEEKQSELIAKESILLEKSGYKGNVINKIYKSARYYFKNKEETVIKARRVYIKQDKNFINMVDRHLENIYNLKPSEAFDDFKTNYEEQINSEYGRLSEFLEKDRIQNKIKKTYKNRYYLCKN